MTREVLELRFPTDVQAEVVERLRAAELGERIEALPDRVVVYTDDGEAALIDVHAMSLAPITALVRRATLEDVFLKLTGRSLVD